MSAASRAGRLRVYGRAFKKSRGIAHEVVKTVGGRRYRYRVENYRDPATGKARRRWTYLGRIAGPAQAGAAPARDPGRTRARLLEAFARLLEREGAETVTAGAIATEAGLAHGTFYRHFADKREALLALFEDLRATVARARPEFDNVVLGDLASERGRIAAWVGGTLEGALERPGVLRAFFAFGSTDPATAEAKYQRRMQLRESLTRHFERLTEAGLAHIERPAELAAALMAVVDGALHVAALERRPFDPQTIAGARDVFDRAIFTIGT